VRNSTASAHLLGASVLRGGGDAAMIGTSPLVRACVCADQTPDKPCKRFQKSEPTIGSRVDKRPANQHNWCENSFWIAPRRSRVRVSLAPLRRSSCNDVNSLSGVQWTHLTAPRAEGAYGVHQVRDTSVGGHGRRWLSSGAHTVARRCRSAARADQRRHQDLGSEVADGLGSPQPAVAIAPQPIAMARRAPPDRGQSDRAGRGGWTTGRRSRARRASEPRRLLR